MKQLLLAITLVASPLAYGDPCHLMGKAATATMWSRQTGGDKQRLHDMASNYPNIEESLNVMVEASFDYPIAQTETRKVEMAKQFGNQYEEVCEQTLNR